MLMYLSHSKQFTYSRNLESIDFPYNISLSKKITDCIVDGELVYIDNDEIIPLCDTGVRKICREIYLIYDIQYLNGNFVMLQSLIERKQLLQSLFDGEKNLNVSIVPYYDCENIDTLKNKFEEIIKDPKKEGLIIKDKFGSYKCNVREWIKLKSLHLTKYKKEFDLYINRALKDKNGLYNILECGSFDENGKFKFVCKVSSGITDFDRGKITHMIDEYGFFREKIQAVIIADRETKNKSLRHPYFSHFRVDLSN